MASITHNGVRHEGRTYSSIARRVWGRTAEVKVTGAQGELRLAHIVKRDKSHHDGVQYFIVADVTLG